MNTLLLAAVRSSGLVVEAPEIFRRPEFIAWLNDPATVVFSWHRKGDVPSDYSDVVVLVDSHYEGDSSDMPADIWTAICDLAYAEYGTGTVLPASLASPIHVRLTNLP